MSTAPAASRALPVASRDLREGGHWTRWQRLKNWGIRQTVRGALHVADRLSEPALLSVGRWLGRCTFRLAPSLRRRAFDRTARCFEPDRAQHIGRACFERAGENLALCVMLRRPSVKASDFVHVSEATKTTLCEAVAQGRGVVFVSAHLGPFELLAATVSELGHSAAVVVRESYDPELDAVVDFHRVTRRLDVIHRGRPGAPARVLRALRGGKFVGFLVDLPSRVRSLSCPFLGGATMIPLGPQRLSGLTGAPLMLGVLQRRLGPSPGRPHFELTLISLAAQNTVQQAGGTQNDRPREHTTPAGDTTVVCTRRVSRLVEEWILEHPEDWPWMA